MVPAFKVDAIIVPLDVIAPVTKDPEYTEPLIPAPPVICKAPVPVLVLATPELKIKLPNPADAVDDDGVAPAAANVNVAPD